ncbi:MAG TPA: histidine phosphatase family protein [Pyrinomonadaceae bacterium]|nr:histidine phosphatase family protein [Pyrinomonadaceae bacterium]
MTTFLLIRHAQCDGVGQILWGRKRNVHLNEDGKSAARALAERVAHDRLDAIYSSPLERALETAEEIAQQSGLEPVNISESFNELDYGDWTGETIESLDRDPVWRRFNTVRTRTRIPGGESILSAQTRIVDGLKRLSLKHENGNVAIVSHADMIKAALAYFAGLDLDQMNQIDVPPCSITRLNL